MSNLGGFRSVMTVWGLLEVGRLAPLETLAAQDLGAAFDLHGDLVVPTDDERNGRMEINVGILAGPSRAVEDKPTLICRRYADQRRLRATVGADRGK